MSRSSAVMTLRDKTLEQFIEKDILFPDFYHDFAEFDSLELTMG